MTKLLLIIFLLQVVAVFGQKDTTKERMIAEIKMEAKPVFIKAQTTLNELRNNVALAKKGMISKEKVVEQYNETVGGTLGRQTTFAGVDSKLKKSGDAYVQFLFTKECARLALKGAAESQFQAELLKN